MPRLLVQKKPSQRKPRGLQYVVPSSPFQKLVDGQMRKRGLSGRQLAADMTDAGAPTSQSTIWTWLHHPSGHPAPRSFKAAHMKALARQLGIKPADLHAAHDASLHRYTPKEKATPAETHEALALLEETIAAGTSSYVKRAWVLHLVQSIRRGANNQAPASKGS